MKQITSVQNPLIKLFSQLQEKAKTRKQTGTFIIEGQREISLAVAGGYVIETLLFYPGLITETEILRLRTPETELIEITHAVFEKIAYRDSTEGVIAIARSRSMLLADLKLSHNPLILVAEAPEKPGNIGALLRTADAAHVDAVLIANPRGDMYNPNIVRSSVGCLFTTQVATGTSAEIIEFLKQHAIAIYCATLQNANRYDLENYTGATALVVGTEAEGLSAEWRDAGPKHVVIPMQGAIDSMNVSVAAAILIFEAKRQRGF